jgi:hypothetical protein
MHKVVISRRSAFIILQSLVIISILIGCSGSELSESEAKKAILKNTPLNGYLIMTGIGFRNTAGIEKLVADGYLMLAKHNFYSSTRKGRQYSLEGKSFPFIYKDYPLAGLHMFYGSTFKEVIKEIKKISIDKHGNTAVVTYLINYEPAEPYYSVVCSKENEKNNYCNKKAFPEHTEQKILKKYSKGWRVLELEGV